MVLKKIAIIEDDSLLRQQIALSLSKHYEILQAGDRFQAEQLFEREKPALALVDLNLPPSGKCQEGIGLIEKAKAELPETIVIVMSGNTDTKETLKAVEAGAHDFFKKPFDLTELKLIIHRALEMQQMRQDNIRLRSELQKKYSFDNIIGNSPAMIRVFESIRRVADTLATVIIRGESGTGKELIARAIHYNSRRKDHPFVSVNCAALPETLVETELFGHERGAFTGAVAMHTGRFELAHEGTLFLDEIGSVSLMVQAKLLRVLQEKTFERVGGTKKLSTDVRLITATNENLEDRVARGEFREDLYYRINVFPIQLPPLRERKEDVPLLLYHFLRNFCEENQIPVKKFHPAALEALLSYSWKGNVRELENLVQTLVLMSDDEMIGLQHLPPSVRGYQSASLPLLGGIPEGGIRLDEAVERFERELLRTALDKVKGVKGKAAEMLGIDKNRMKYLCRKYKF
ncbi:sigma-54 dependent transcriptional regulator [bacterium]|nr:sigma-54 dependent transcriptional regulator [bacterium]MCI0605900.1 sigma-54 dependent transcriptional regulator [bacterium]